MKYEGPKIINGVPPEQTSACFANYTFVPKGLSRVVYDCLENFHKNRHWIPCTYSLYIKDRTKEDLFNISKQLSDYNIGYIVFPSCTDTLEVHPNETADAYATEFRLLKYSSEYEGTELNEDISRMTKEGWQMVKFGYIPEANAYVAKFHKNHTEQ